ncbi:dTDP-L-rhamnose 4-epimerase [Microbacteriaceae bacterium SG_E_30_P1]|uniref:dTDP-L-rhamnose 4-epimerase n=1 Tax=Antiquaquibacter oligotrophicus TaxID=2880260 RepID=A0ABT6KPK8_9MICO|nr:NAD-dependent epimerase/dehydratase family protein [Antiquaquibacter oligotrophicus]MDH6181705.1 dTDP-L-rhamnose 4-epimerase [Antiquaquibacter oligotrophicus]UDF12612.1 NAD-dependent epimerase/dehydratase family protein [Antiquaquibacter oligotrophicus]
MTLGTVLVTGGAGFIGCALADRLVSSADRWIAFDSLHSQVHPGSERPAALHESAELVVADVTDPGAWDALLADTRPDTIIHLAAETGTAQSLDEASRHSRVNVVGTTELTDALGRSGHLPSHVVLASSRAVYGEGTWQRADGTVFQPGMRSHAQLEAGQWDFPDAVAVPESSLTTPPAPTSVYGATKLAQENLLTAWGGARGVPVSILRLQNVYGPGQSLINSYTGIVSLFSQWAREGKQIPLYEDGKIIRDFVFIDDVAWAIAATLAAGPDDARPVLDVGTGVATTIHDMASAIADYYGAPEPTVVGKFRDGDVRAASADISATTTWLDWQPTVSLTQGVAALQDWIGATRPL